VRTVSAELEKQGWKAGESNLGNGLPLAIDRKTKSQVTSPRYQVFHDRTGGVEVVEMEPTDWTFGDRQTMWNPGSGKNDPAVVTIFVTRQNMSIGWWARVKRKFQDIFNP
jgi:hypothetical protein